jgi:cytoskeleton protein RodZ
MDSYSLGQQLREAREAKEITLAQAETTLKIRRHILEGFEQGDFNVVDASPVQIRGFIRNYARFLSLEEDRILQYYDSMLESANRQRIRRESKKSRRDKRNSQVVQQTRSTGEINQVNGYGSLAEQRQKPSTASRLLNLLLIFIVGVIALGVIGFVTLQLVQTPPTNLQVEDENNGIIADIPPTFTWTPRPSVTPIRTVTVVPQQQNYTGQPVLVTLEVRQRCWLHFEVDGVLQYSGLLRPGEAVIEYAATNEILVRASNAAALVVTYNGVAQPAFGGRGQRVEVTFRPNNDIEIVSGPGLEPTLEFSATPQPTPTSIVQTLVAELTPTATETAGVELTQPTLLETAIPTNTLEASTEAASTSASFTPTVTLTLGVTTSPSETSIPSTTPTSTLAPTLTLTPTVTLTPSQTVIMPPRITPTPATPVKQP